MIRAHVLLAQVPPAAHEPPTRGLSASEIQRMQRYLQLRDRWLFAAARMLLRHGLAELYGITAPRVRIDPHGRPHLESGDPDFNFSHTAGLVACAFAQAGRIGVDVEPCDRAPDALALSARFFAPAEHAAIAAAADVTTTFLRIWTLKEAISKAVGLGLGLPLNSFTVSLDPTRVGFGDENWHLAEHKVAQSHHVAVALRGQGEIAFEMLPLETLLA